MDNPLAGVSYLLRGFSLLWRPGVRLYVIVPLLINTLIFAALITFTFGQFGNFVDWLIPELPDWLQWLAWLLWILFAISALLLLFFTFALVANLVGAPFNSLLAEAVVFQETGARMQDGGRWTDFLRGFFPSLVNEIRKLGYTAGWAIPCLLLFLVPVINLIAPLVWLGYGAWMMALEYADYPMGNSELAFHEQRKLVREKRLLWLGFGGATLAGTLIPVINFLMMPAATIGATLLWIEHYPQHSKPQTGSINSE